MKAIHEQQEKLIANNEDIILASSYPYDRYVPAALDYEEETYIPSECYYENGKKLDIEEAFRRVCLIVDFDTELNNTSKTNGCGGFAFILVLFILVILVGAAWVN